MIRTALVSRLCATLVGLSVLGVGCQTSEQRGTGEGASLVSVAAGALSGASRGCEHPYYPLREGYQIRYEIQSRDLRGASQINHYSQRVQEVRANSVKLVTTFEDLGADQADQIQATQTFACNDGMLQADAYVDLGSRLTGAASQFQVTTRRVTGEMLPRDLRVGSAWDGSFEISMGPADPTANDNPLTESIDLNIRMHREVVAEELVTVPAGTYRALKVIATTDFASAGITPGAPLTTTEWWAENAGLVKSVYVAGGAMGDIVTVAQEVNVP
jgi:hypothetical protein